MEKITLIRCDDNTIWVTSDENQIGSESKFNKIKDEKKRMMIALAEFLGYEPARILDFSGMYEYEFEDDEGLCDEEEEDDYSE